LDQSRCFKLTQKIARADQSNPLIDDRPAFLDVGVFEQKQCFGIRVGAKKSFKRLHGGQFAKPANGTAKRRCWSMPISVGTILTRSRWSLIHATICSAPGAPWTRVAST